MRINIVIPFAIVVLVAVVALVKLTFAERANGRKTSYLRNTLDCISGRYVALVEYAMNKFYAKNGGAPVDENGRTIPFGAKVSFDNGHIRRHGILVLNLDDNDRIDETCPFVFYDRESHETFHPGLVRRISVEGEGRFL